MQDVTHTVEDPASSSAWGPVRYPESDDMGESGLQLWVRTVLIDLLTSYFAAAERPVLVGGDQFFYFYPRNNKVRVAPDVYLIEDEQTPLRRIRSWRRWEHDGKGPALAVEVVSEEYEKDYAPDLLSLYQELGVKELIRYDPDYLLHPRATKHGPRRLLTHHVRNDEGRLIERPLVRPGLAKSAIYDFWYVCHSSQCLRLGTGPRGQSLWPTKEERAALEAERAALEAERADAEADRAKAESARAKLEAERATAEAERATAEAERATAEAERAAKAEQEVAQLRSELARLRGQAP